MFAQMESNLMEEELIQKDVHDSSGAGTGMALENVYGQGKYNQ